MGLRPEHRMLDIGCGTLRGGRHFVRYLDRSNYTGIDISPACIEAAKDLIENEKLQDRMPTLILNRERNMLFSEFKEKTFDFILAQSVFTHLPEDIIQECFQNIGKCMHGETAFYFTYFQSDERQQIATKDFAYPWSFFCELAAASDFEATEMSEHYDHPRDQKMGRVVRKAC